VQIKIIQDSAARFLRENASSVLTAGGVVGTVATAVLAVRAGMKTQEIIQSETSRRYVETRNETGDIDLAGLTKREKVMLVAPQFVPPVVVGSLTIASIIGANVMSAKRAAALAAAYGMSQKHFDEYKAKVEEKLGLAKEQKIQDEVAQDRVNQTGERANTVVIFGDEVICYDQPTDRYFKGTMAMIHKAVNSTNQEIIQHGYASATYFYNELEMEGTTWTDDVGWSDPFELDITQTLTPDQRPCIAIDFKRLPERDFMRGHYS
jgi:acetyl-CoA acetyltransferase